MTAGCGRPVSVSRCSLLGMQSWFWTRAALNARHGFRDIDAPQDLSWQERWAPRMTLIPITLIAISPLLMAREGRIPRRAFPGQACFGVARVFYGWVRGLGTPLSSHRRMQNTLPHQTRPRRSNTPGPPPLQVWRCLCGRSQADGRSSQHGRSGLAGNHPEPKQLSGPRTRNCLSRRRTGHGWHGSCW